MSVASIRRILGDRSARLSGNEPEVPLSDCAYLSSKALPKGLGLMFANHRLVRIDVFEGATRTKSGIGLGIVFETDGKIVTSIRAGTEAAIALVEGCS